MKTKSWPTLYKQSSTGKEQQWTIEVEFHSDGAAAIVTEHGQVGGKLQEARVSVTKGKNLGKANATNPHQQAESEAQAKWTKQLDKGYSQERGGGSMELKPMLAHKYEDKKKQVVFDNHSFVQPKLDGMRCLAYRETETLVRLISRQGNEIQGLQHIRLALGKVMKVGEIWDGELFKHGMPFQEIISLVKKPQDKSVEIQYHVYDYVIDQPFCDRSFAIALALDPAGTEAAKPHVIPDDCLVRVPTLRVTSHEQVEQLHEKYVADGYEGVMLRWGQEPYKRGYRSSNLLKVKAFQDDEFPIVDIIEGKGKFEGRAIFVCKTPDGARFEAVPKGRDELRQRYFKERESIIGKMLTVRFFEWTTSTPPAPRFPVAIEVRSYE